MYNLSTSIIAFEVVENNTVIHSGQIPYDLLDTVTEMYLIGTARQFKYQVLQDEFITTPVATYTAEDVAALDAKEDQSTRIYNYIQTHKYFLDRDAQSEAEFALFQASVDAGALVDRERILAEYASAGELLLQQSVEHQSTLLQSQIDSMNQEAYRIDTLRAQTVTSVAVNPASSVDALMSEVGKSMDVQRQVASVMRPSKEITMLVASSTSTLWINSYEIMDTLAHWATVDDDVAQVMIAQLPSDSLLVASLKLLKPELN